MTFKALVYVRQLSMDYIQFDVQLIDHDEAINQNLPITYIERTRSGKKTGRVAVLLKSQNKDYDHAEMLLLYYLADNCNKRGIVDDEAIDKLAYVMNRSPRQTQRYIQRLIWHGEIQCQVNSGNKRKNVYIVTPNGKPLSEYPDIEWGERKKRGYDDL